MANTSSAKKETRKIARRTEVNKARRTRMRSFVRKVEEAIASATSAACLSPLEAAQPILMSTAQQGVTHKRAASRKVSRLAHRVKAMAT